MYIEITEASLNRSIPPPDGPIIGVSGKNTIVDDHHVIDTHGMADEDMGFYGTRVGMDIVEAHTIVEACYDQFLAYDVTHVY